MERATILCRDSEPRQAKAPTKRACTGGDRQVLERIARELLRSLSAAPQAFHAASTGFPQDRFRPNGADHLDGCRLRPVRWWRHGQPAGSSRSSPCWPWRRRRRWRRAGSAPRAASARRAAPPARPLFRVILNDGTALVSYGEFTRVGDRVVFSMPLDSPRGERLQLVNLPASVVNWESTEQYATATRYAQYVASARRGRLRRAHRRGGARAERDRARQGPRARAPDRRADAADARRVADRALRLPVVRRQRHAVAARRARSRSSAATARHPPVSTSDLVATIEPPSMPLLPDPTATQAIDQVMLAARLSDVPAERITLLRSAISAIDEKAAQLPKQLGAPDARGRPRPRSTPRLAIERRYAELSRSTVARANAAAVGCRRARRRAGGGDAAGARPRARREAEGPGRRPAGPAAGEAGLGPAPPPASRPVGAQGRGVSRLPGRRSRGPIDRLAKLEPRLEDVKSLAGPDVVDAARSDAALRAHQPAARAHQAPARPGPGARDAAVVRRARAAGDAHSRARRVQGDVADGVGRLVCGGRLDPDAGRRRAGRSTRSRVRRNSGDHARARSGSSAPTACPPSTGGLLAGLRRHPRRSAEPRRPRAIAGRGLPAAPDARGPALPRRAGLPRTPRSCFPTC